MEYGTNYRVTYRTAVNRDWTTTKVLRYTGIDGDQAMFIDAEKFNQTAKPFGLTIDRIISIEQENQ